MSDLTPSAVEQDAKIFLNYRLHVMRKTPLYRLLSHFIDDIDSNPRVQLMIHRVGFWYWVLNFPIITYMFFCQQQLWSQYGLFITLIYSIYANFTSDYTGMSASQTVINTETTKE
jgi:hypothetical protein